MKKLTFLFIVLLFGTVKAYGQLKIGYIDSDAIMKELPDAQDAQKKIDAQIQEWQDELRKMEAGWKLKYNDYNKRKLIMSNKKRAETEQELMKIEKNISDFRQKKFGVNGELFKKQEDLMKPIQNRVFNAIQEVAKEQDLDFVFDKSGSVLFLYAKKKYDITSLVLDKLKNETK